MDADLFWLSERQFARIAPHLPTDTRGKPRVDDRRVISGIIQIMLSGARWEDAPSAYGPRKTLYNRFQRWAAKGVWARLFEALAQSGGPSAELLIDSSAVKAHRCASGGKRGSDTTRSAEPGNRPIAWRAHDQDLRADGCRLPAGRLRADRRQRRGLHEGGPAAGASLERPADPRRQGLRHQRGASTDRGQGRRAEHPAQGQPGLEELLFAGPLSDAKCH